MAGPRSRDISHEALMAVARPHLRQLSAEARQRLESILAGFEEGWNEGRLATSARRLADEGSLRLPALIEMVKIDLERQWHRGGRPGIETYLRQYPELGTAETVSADLLLAEYQVRRQFNAPANLDEFRQRFPRSAEQLAELLLHATDHDPCAVCVQDRRGTDALPAKIGRFEVRSKLGAGAFGTVYRAYDPQLDREVALKVPQAVGLDDPNSVERFLREAKAAARLRHPHIVPLYEAGKDGSQYYIASAFIEGRTLSRSIHETTLKFRPAAQIVQDLAEALGYAHEQGVIHRDVKSGNVMLDAKGKALLMDFGLAYRHDSTQKLTQEGAILGTPAYIAPEQAQGKSGDALPASDQYGLGVILYEMLCGQTPFSGPTEIVLFNAIHQEPPAPRTIKPSIPRDLETICLKALAKRPEDRYASCQEMADDLRRWREGEPIQVRRLGSVERVARWCRREPLMAAQLAAIACLLVAGASVSCYFAIQANRKAIEAEANAKQALQQEERANEKAAEALREQQRADQKATEAQANAKLMGQEKERADLETERVRDEKRKVERYLYVAQMNVAQRYRDAVAIDRLQEILNEQDPRRTGSTDLRGWEWYYLRRLCHAWRQTLKGHQHTVWQVAFSPDGQRLASASEDRTLKVWDTTRGQVCFPLIGHTKGIGSLTYRPDGKQIASASDDHSVRIWDAATGRLLRTLDYHTDKVISVVYRPDGKQLASGSADKTVIICDAATGEKLRVLQMKFDDVRCLAYSPDGKRLCAGGGVSGQRAGWGAILDAESGQEIFTLKDQGHSEAVTSVDFSRDGQWLASGSEDHTVRIWNATTGKRLHILPGHSSSVYAVAFGPDGWLASGGADGMAFLWDTSSGRERFRIRAHRPHVHGLAFSPDGLILATASCDRTVNLWDMRTAQGALTLQHRANSVAFSPNGQWLASAGGDKFVKLWDPTTGRELHALPHDAVVYDVAFSPDGTLLASAGTDRIIRLWNPATNQEVRSLPGHSQPIRNLAFSCDGRWLASASGDQTARIWDVSTGREERKLMDLGGPVYAVAFSPDGTRLASGGPSGIVKLWDPTTGDNVRSLQGHTEAIQSVAFSHDGKWLASSSADQTVRIWDAQTGREAVLLHGHTGDINGVAFSPDDQRLVTASADRSVKIWDAMTGQELLTLHGHTRLVSWAIFSPDGKRVASASMDGVKIWDATHVEEKTGRAR